MILDSTTESITVATSTNAALDVVAFFVDMDATTTEGKNQLTQIAAITTATIVDAPAASTQRQIRAITIRNKGAIPCVVTIGLLAGATTYETHKRTIVSIHLAVGDDEEPDKPPRYPSRLFVNDFPTVQLIQRTKAQP